MLSYTTKIYKGLLVLPANHRRKTKSHSPLTCQEGSKRRGSCLLSVNSSSKGAGSSIVILTDVEAGPLQSTKKLVPEACGAEQPVLDEKFKDVIGRCSMTWRNSVLMTTGQALLTPKSSVCVSTPQARLSLVMK